MWPFRWAMHRRRGLKMAVVSMLAASPKNGVELMNEIERMTQGWWRPSPGSVYPVLEQLVDDGMIRKRDDGRYELTEKAHDEVEWTFGPGFRRPRTTEDMMTELSGFVSYLEELSRADPAATAPYLEKARELGERLSKVAAKKE
jgi:DNA-binding PadR family transcriptional regulator